MSVDVQRYPVTDVEGRRVAAAVVARAALRFGLMRAAAVVLVLVVLLVALLRHEAALLGLAAGVPIICMGVSWVHARCATAAGGSWWVARSESGGIAVLRAAPRETSSCWWISDFAAIPRGQGLGKALTETLARELPPGTVLEGTVVTGRLVGTYRAWGYEVTPRPRCLGLLFRVRRTL